MSETVLRLENIETYYGKIHALRGINFAVQKGQIVALLGANGAGKSTTLRTISAITPAASGRTEFLGRDITKEQAHNIVRMGLIHVPEGRRIFKGLTVSENLDLGAFTLNGSHTLRAERKDHVFQMFPRLKERRNQDAAFLSGGEQQMLAIGRALMVEPKLLLLDEPSMGLAPFLVQEIMRTIRRLNEEGTTILLVEQNAKVALKLADYGYVLETGQIVIEGTGSQLQKDESIVKAYLGT